MPEQVVDLSIDANAYLVAVEELLYSWQCMLGLGQSLRSVVFDRPDSSGQRPHIAQRISSEAVVGGTVAIDVVVLFL